MISCNAFLIYFKKSVLIKNILWYDENYIRINNTNLFPDEVSNMIIERFKLV